MVASAKIVVLMMNKETPCVVDSIGISKECSWRTSIGVQKHST